MKNKYFSISAILISIVLGCTLHAEDDSDERTLRVAPISKQAIPATPSDGAVGLETAPLSTTIKPAKRSISSVPASATAIPGRPDAVLQTPLLITAEHKRNRDERTRQFIISTGKDPDGFKRIDPSVQDLIRRLSRAESEFVRLGLLYTDQSLTCIRAGAISPRDGSRPGISVSKQREARCRTGDTIQACIDKWINFCTTIQHQDRVRAKVELLDILGEFQQFLQTRDYSSRH